MRNCNIVKHRIRSDRGTFYIFSLNSRINFKILYTEHSHLSFPVILIIFLGLTLLFALSITELLPSRFRVEITNFRSKMVENHCALRVKAKEYQFRYFFFFFPCGIRNSPMIYDSPLYNCAT